MGRDLLNHTRTCQREGEWVEAGVQLGLKVFYGSLVVSRSMLAARDIHSYK